MKIELNFKEKSLQYLINYFGFVVCAFGMNVGSLLWAVKTKDSGVGIFAVLCVVMSIYSLFAYEALINKINSGDTQ